MKILGIYFMRLVGYLGMYRKSKKLWARNFDPKGVNASRKPNPGTLCPPPRVIGVNNMNFLIPYQDIQMLQLFFKSS